eukprot:6177528-Pleurochrysis_carterae.AAC.1
MPLHIWTTFCGSFLLSVCLPNARFAGTAYAMGRGRGRSLRLCGELHEYCQKGSACGAGARALRQPAKKRKVQPSLSFPTA